jgi:murein DD-endopeptidase MepM/ murein hydrolase activator NlpD
MMRSLRSVTLLVGLAFLGGLAGCQTEQGLTWPAFGKYRVPYEDGTEVKVSDDGDFETHNGRYDLDGQNDPPYTIVAAADGWIRSLVDTNEENPDEDPHTHNNYIWIEHPYPFCQPPGVNWTTKPADYDETCIPCLGRSCNEWTKYSHMRKGSSTAAGRVVGQFVSAGVPLGIEGDVGHANGEHLHWAVSKMGSPAGMPDPDGNMPNCCAGDWVFAPFVLPSICGVGVMKEGMTFTAAPCD